MLIVLNPHSRVNMNMFGITFQALLQVLLSTSILGYSIGRNSCDVITDTSASACGYNGISELECIERGCCWKPCENCAPDTPRCIRSKVAVPPAERETRAAEEGQLRIKGCSVTGRLETYVKGRWRPFCDDSFSWKAAIIVCRQILFHEDDFRRCQSDPGVNEANAVSVGYCGGRRRYLEFGQNSGQLQIFKNGEWGPYCYDNFNGKVVAACQNLGLGGPNGTGTLRLVGPEAPAKGRLEIFYEGEWGTICADGFTQAAATVACRQLGFTNAVTKFRKSGMYSQANVGQILLDDVSCTGEEDNLISCKNNGWTNHNCFHRDDIRLDCA